MPSSNALWKAGAGKGDSRASGLDRFRRVRIATTFSLIEEDATRWMHESVPDQSDNVPDAGK
jgi:hypothetical protein